MGGLSEGLYEPGTEIYAESYFNEIDVSFPDYPSTIDFTTQSDTRSIEYSYIGVFENAFEISGRGLESPGGWLETGLYLTGEKGGIFWLRVPYDGYQYAREIVNTGTISGTEYSIYSDSYIETLIRNVGELRGDVKLGNGLDQLVNTGKIVGSLFAGDEERIALYNYDLIENHGIITGSVNLGDGNDIYLSFGNARVGSKTEPAAVRGMDGNDTLTGANRADKFLGGKGQDTLIGGKGDDRLIGNQDDDLLRGDAGDDLLAGGLGKDWLYGGDGADVFLFRSVLTSQGNGMADRIADFETGTDRIDLSHIADSIDFISMGDFTGTGQTELRYDVGDRGTAQVFLDVDGDGRNDMRINLLKTDTLSEADFIL